MRKIRAVHMWLGCFFSPLLLFYLATGWYQTFHVNRNKGLGEKGDWIEHLTSVHVDQILPAKNVEKYSPQLFQGLVIAMSIALILTLLLGLVLAFRMSRKQWPIWLALALGTGVPVLFLFLGHRR